MITNYRILQELQKAVTTDTITALVPEDLEIEAHNILWKETSRSELTLLKLCPTTSTRSIKHEYDRITSFGDSRGQPFFSEQALPLETQPAFQRVQTFVRLIGEMSSTFILASLEATVKVDGVQGADAISRRTLQKNLLYKKNRAMYFSDASKTRLGNDGLRFQGLIQQIREGTDGTTGTSPYGSHVIDMEGLPFNFDNIRSRAAASMTLFGYLSDLIMPPFVRADLEAGLDNAVRLNTPIGARAFMVGQNTGGMHALGGDIWFHTDNVLTPIYSQAQYVASAQPLAPAGTPTFSGTVNSVASGDNVSKWLSTDAGDYAWLATEVKNEREGLGARWPTSSTEAIAENNEVEFSITPSDALSDSFKIYRLHDDQADTKAFFIFEVANSEGGSAVTAYDLNQDRPGTSTVFGLCLANDVTNMLHAPSQTGLRDSYATAAEESARFLSAQDYAQNTVTMVKLGPDMGVMTLAQILATLPRPLLYSACAMQLRNALQNVVWKNVGSTSQPSV